MKVIGCYALGTVSALGLLFLCQLFVDFIA
jgi:hypothetical protein